MTVVGEGGTERQDLGNWLIHYGAGNVQSTYGAAALFTIGDVPGTAGLDGELDVLNSDVTGEIRVERGTLRVHAGSKVGNVSVFPLGSAYISEFSQAGSLQTQAGSYLSLEDSITNGTGCVLQGTVRARSSSIGCGSLNVDLGGMWRSACWPRPHPSSPSRTS